MTDNSPESAGLLVPRCYPSFPWAFGSYPHLPGTSPYTAPADSCYPIYELQIMFFWTREAPASPRVHACSCPELFTAPVYRRVDNTAFLCPHGSFMFCPYLFGWSQWRYWPDVGSGSIFTCLFIFLWVSAYGVYVGAASYCDGVQGSEDNLLRGSSRFPPCSLREGLSGWFGPCAISSTQLMCELLDDSPICFPSPHWSMGIIGTHLWIPGFGLRSSD